MTESKSSLNYVSKTNKNILTQSSNSNSASNKNNKENFYDFYEEEIKENFEEFNIDNGNDKDLYVNHKFLYELDTKDNANFEQNIVYMEDYFQFESFSPKRDQILRKLFFNGDK